MPSHRLIRAQLCALAVVIRNYQLTVDLYLLAINSSVGDPVLSATVGAASDVHLQVLIKTGQSLFQFLDQPAGETLRLRDCQLAELRPAASYGPAPKRRPADRQSDRA